MSFSSYRNQLINLICKPVDWFLYHGNFECEWIKEMKPALAFNFHQISTGVWNSSDSLLQTTLDRYTGKAGLWTHGLYACLDCGRLDDWTLDDWTLDAGRLDSGRFVYGRVHAWTVDVLTLDGWTLDAWALG